MMAPVLPLHPVRVVPLSSAQVGMLVRGMAIVLLATLRAPQHMLETLNLNSVLTAEGTQSSAVHALARLCLLSHGRKP